MPACLRGNLSLGVLRQEQRGAVVADTAEKLNLMGLSPGELEDFFRARGEKPFRVQQILRWIYQFGVNDFAVMSNLRKELRASLAEECCICAPEVVSEQRSRDGTVKWALDIGDGQFVESVLIPEEDRNTLCISTQAGCAVGCAFCRTGAGGFSRNLSLSEIIGQVWRAAERTGFSQNQEHKPISNVVMMGMGEPLLNLKPVLKAVEILLSDYGFALSKRRVTISTAGVAPVIARLAEHADVALALSLHAPDDALRDRLVPLNRQYNIAAVLKAVRSYLGSTNANCGKVTIEYVLLDRINDFPEQARALARLLANIPCKINLIPFNPCEGTGFGRPAEERMEKFYRTLSNAGFTVIRRTTRGDDIAAACGQLAGQIKNRLAPRGIRAKTI